MGKWMTPLGLKVPLIQIQAQVSPHTLIEALLDATIRDDRACYEGFALWQAEQLESLARRIREEHRDAGS